jgi:hypothetical protein
VSSEVNAISMLTRLELRGIAAGARWQPLADAAEARLGEHVLAFLDLHDALALAYAGRQEPLARLSDSARRHAGTATLETREAWTRAGLPLLAAIRAAAAGDWDTAAAISDHALPEALVLGGSSAQRAVFHEFATHARSRAGRRLDG